MKIVHVFNEYKPQDIRHIRARASWNRLVLEKPSDIDYLIHGYDNFARNGLDVGDKRPVPFWRDVINACGLYVYPEKDSEGCELPNDFLILFTNMDSYLAYDSLHMIKDHLKWHGGIHGPLFSKRVNMYKPLRHRLSSYEIKFFGAAANVTGEPFIGVDLVVFPAWWWKQNQEHLPDLLIGYQGWDYLIRAIGLPIKDLLGNEIPLVAHEMHGEPYWRRHKDCAGNQWNWDQLQSWSERTGINIR